MDSQTRTIHRYPDSRLVIPGCGSLVSYADLAAHGNLASYADLAGYGDLATYGTTGAPGRRGGDDRTVGFSGLPALVNIGNLDERTWLETRLAERSRPAASPVLA